MCSLLIKLVYTAGLTVSPSFTANKDGHKREASTSGDMQERDPQSIVSADLIGRAELVAFHHRWYNSTRTQTYSVSCQIDSSSVRAVPITARPNN